jgi:hypothetical protein
MVRSSASSFNLQYLLFSLRSSSSFLRLLPRLPVISALPYNFPSITCFRRPFFFLFYVRYSFPRWLYVILLHFSHDRSNWSSKFFSKTTFQNFPGISDLLSEVSILLKSSLWTKMTNWRRCLSAMEDKIQNCKICVLKIFINFNLQYCI